MGVRFVHTADWQLGMRRHYLSPEAQARFDSARIEAIRGIGRLAADHGAAFVIACGDLFESNQVDRRTVSRALEAMRDVGVPLYLLPGNHDPLEPGSVYTSPSFVARKPGHAHVVADSTPIEVAPGVELVGAPWVSKRPLTDLVAAACADLHPSDVLRICAGHGIVDRLCADRDNPAVISADDAEALIEQRAIHYLALGDRHSATSIGSTGRIWYAGSPEPTDYDEVNPGCAVVVELDEDGCNVTSHHVGEWRFVRATFDLRSEADVVDVSAWFEAVVDKDRTVAKVVFTGEVSLRVKARLDAVIEDVREVFAAVEVIERDADLVVLPDRLDLENFQLTGFARTSADQLLEQARGGHDTATDALALLYRLSVGAP
ncbi:MAG: metallophosphoesterase [Actinomycetota bacterium]|nr:metallophosphoesterase [Actinomycetota bacterium]